MAKGYVGIPTSYTPVEYIEGTGTQYIDTGYKPNTNTKVELKISNLPTRSKYQAIYGGRTRWDTSDRYSMQCNSSNKYVFDYGGTTYTFPEGISTVGETEITQNKNVATIGSEAVTGNTATFNTAYNMYIFSVNNADEAYDTAAFNLYYFKIWDNGTLVRDFIPVLDENNVACLYEQVEGKFYYNKGTGTFTAGSTTGEPVYVDDFARKLKKGYAGINNVARKIKKGYVGVQQSYTPIEYIESSGTQYIDTGIRPYKTQTEVTFALTSTSGNTNEAIGGTWNANDNRYYISYAVKSSTPTQFFSCSRTNTEIALGSLDTNTHTILYNDTNNKVFFDNVEKGTISDLTEQTTKSIPLFCIRWQAQDTYFASMKLYSCKITDKDTNTLVRDFSPVKDSNGVACLYDKVTETFYYNKGAGSFTAGSTIGSPVVIGDKARLIFEAIPAYTPLSYIEGNGTQYIDTEVFINDNTCVDVKFEGTRSSSNDYLCGADNPLYHIGGVSGGKFQVSTSLGDYFSLANADSRIHTIVYNDINKKIIYDGSTYQYDTATFPDSTTSMYLFTKNPASGTRRYTKVYYCKISNRLTGELYRDLVPAIRQEDGVVCLFDKVSNKFFVNKGTGNFIAGPVMT